MTLYMQTNILFFIISRSFLLRMRNVSDNSCRENQNTHFLFSNLFFPKIMPFMRKCGKNILERGRTQMTVWRMRIVCWITKTTHTHKHKQICNTYCFFHCSNFGTNATQICFISLFLVLLRNIIVPHNQTDILEGRFKGPYFLHFTFRALCFNFCNFTKCAQLSLHYCESNDRTLHFLFLKIAEIDVRICNVFPVYNLGSDILNILTERTSIYVFFFPMPFWTSWSSLLGMAGV